MKRKLTARDYSLLLAGEFAALGAGAVIILVFIASTLDASLIQNGQQAAVVTSVLTELTNTDRTRNGVGKLTVNPKLTAIAQAKANDMAQNGYFAHTSPDGKTPWYWLKQGGYVYTYAGENLAVNFSDSAAVEAAWMKSPTHRANLLNGKFTEVGIATAVGMYKGEKTTFVVQVFGTPNPSTTSTAPPPKATTPATKQALVETPAVLGASEEAAPEEVLVQELPAEPTVSKEAAPTIVPVAEPTGSMRLWNALAASPRSTLQYSYYLFGFLILAALLIQTGLEWKRRHLRHVAVALCLIALMGTLFTTADHLIFTTPTLSEAAVTSVGS